ncbi:hypothetical protein TIFTF001_043101 [Ficus carica]|uniref:Uncharacterized protein n=1 Tax=Ficus carica TaxID=3494 RepID=A0AA87YYU1_FICCA|nr:hypothetical protein TIFTF001_043098 [Ficus carica]GMN20505.1 hypothetical protein TIFTF001_043101 [Ficus carica]
MDKKKQVIEDMDVEWTSTDSSDSSSDDDELALTIRRSRFEYEFEHKRADTGTSNEASEKSRPVTTSGAEALSIPPVARLTKPPRRVASDFLMKSSFASLLKMNEWTRCQRDGYEFKKPPPKALLFEEKLERLLAQPNREWDKINIPKRFRALSLWKNFVELPSGIAKQVPSWVDWPFVIRKALRRLFGPPLFIEPLSDEEALITEFTLDTMVMEFPNPKNLLAKRNAKKEVEKAAAAAAAASSQNVQGNELAPFPILESSLEPPSKPVSPPAKKRKAVEKAKRKIPTKRNKRSKVATPEPNVEGLRIEVDLPPKVRLLQDQQTSVEIMRQLLSEADAETLGQGSLQSHLDDLL